MIRNAALLNLVAALFGLGVARVAAQSLPAPDDTRHEIRREAILGLLPTQASVPEIRARQHCLEFPVDPPNDRLQGPHSDSLVSASCEVAAFNVLNGQSPARWIAAHYRWTSLFTAEDAGRGLDARDTVTEEEVVLFDGSVSDQVRPVWHERFETGVHGVWASITLEVAQTSRGTTILSVMSCVNGTGGCSQEFLHLHPDGRWFPVWQDWLDQLPRGFQGRIRHGVRIDPRTLRGECGFYGDGDPNCCPSQRLVVDLTLDGDSLVLRRQELVREPAQ